MDRAKRLLPFVVGTCLVCCGMPTGWLCAEPMAQPRSDDPTAALLADASLRDLVFVDRENGWAVGEHGAIWHTTDGGTHWHEQHSGTNVGLHGVTFVNRRSVRC